MQDKRYHASKYEPGKVQWVPISTFELIINQNKAPCKTSVTKNTNMIHNHVLDLNFHRISLPGLLFLILRLFIHYQLLEKSNFEIIPINAHSNLLLPYVPITYNLPIIIRIPGTNLTLSQKGGKVIEKEEKPISFLLQTTNPIVLAYSEEKNHIRYKVPLVVNP